jgi:MoxR-like ATPase
VVLTSNRTREVHDALKRRCLWHWIPYPDLAREISIVRHNIPSISEQLAWEVATTVKVLRSAGLTKPPGISEAIDLARCLYELDATSLAQSGDAALGAVVKHQDDAVRARRDILPMLMETLAVGRTD